MLKVIFFYYLYLIMFIRYNKLLNTIHTSLQELLKAMKGLVVLSQGLEEMSKSLFNNSVPVMWSKAVYFYLYGFLKN